MKASSLGCWASSSCIVEFCSSARPCSVSAWESCWKMHDQHEPEVAGAQREVVGVLAGLAPAHEVPGLVDEHDRAPGEARRARARPPRALCALPVALDGAGDVLHDREHHGPQDVLRAAAGVEDDQRAVGRRRWSRGRAGRRRCRRRTTRSAAWRGCARARRARRRRRAGGGRPSRAARRAASTRAAARPRAWRRAA